MFNYFFGNKTKSNFGNKSRVSKTKVIEELVKRLDDKTNFEARIENKVTQMMENFIQTSSTILRQQVEQRVESLENEIRQTIRNRNENDTQSNNNSNSLNTTLIHQVVGHTGGFANNEILVKENQSQEFFSYTPNNTPNYSNFSNRNQGMFRSLRAQQRNNHSGSTPNSSIHNQEEENNQVIEALIRRIQETESKLLELNKPEINKENRRDKSPKRSNSRIRHLLKMLPKYSGDPDDDIEEWFFSMERYFEKADTPDDEQVDFAEDFLTGSAKVAFRSLDVQRLNWKSFKTAFLEWFQPADHQAILRNKLINLQQTSNIQEYIHQFDSITNSIKHMGEEDKITFFIRGIKPFTAGFVKMKKCKTLMEAKKEALSADNNFGGYFNSRNGQTDKFQHKNTKLKNSETANENIESEEDSFEAFNAIEVGNSNEDIA